MATFETRYSTTFNYAKSVGDSGAVTLINRLNQKNNQTFPLMHSADISIGDDESTNNRLNKKLESIDNIFRDIYGVAPSVLEAYTDTNNGATVGLASLASIAGVLNNRTETIDDRLVDLRMFKTVSVGVSNTATSNLTEGNSAAVNLTAISNQDTLTINPENKWIILKANSSNKSFTIGHYASSFTATTDVNDLNSNSTFTVPYIGYDNAGHIISKNTTTYTLPYNFKKIQLFQSDSASDLTTNTTAVEANNQIAEITFSAGNKWIKLAGNNNSKIINFAHKLSSLSAAAHNSSWALNAQSPSFGSTFDILIPSVSFTTDEAGHITAYNYNSTMSTVTIPKGAIETKTNSIGNVLINLELADTSMTLTRSFEYISNLTLTGYSFSATSAAETITSTDTLATALSKVQNSLNLNNTAISNEVVNRGTAISSAINGLTKTNVGLNKVDNVQQIQAVTTENNMQGKIVTWGNAGNTVAISDIDLDDLIGRIEALESYVENQTPGT